MKLNTIIFSLVASFSLDLQAACPTPCSPAGQFQYNSPDWVYCDGCTWNSMIVSNTGTTCSSTGALNSTGTDLQYCSSGTGNWMSAVGAQTAGACSANGAIQWDATNKWMTWCNSSTWKVLQSGTGPAYVSKGEALLSGCTNCTTSNFSSATTTGNLVVCGVTSFHTAYSTSMDDNAGNTYTLIGTLPGAGTGWKTELYYKENITGRSSFKVTAHFANAGDTAISCAEYSGIQTVNSFDQFTTKSCTGTTCAVGPTPTTTTAKELIVLYASSADNDSVGAGYTLRTSTAGSSIGDKIGTTLTTYSSSLSDVNSGYDVFLATFRSK